MTTAARIAAGPRFQQGVLAVILLNALIIGIETDAATRVAHAGLFHALHLGIQAIFVVEIGIRLAAAGPRYWRFFTDGWNVFDFAVVAVSMLPAAGPLATVARLARVLRALRLVTALPELRLIVATMLRSIPSLGNVILLLGLILYLYAVIGVHVFGAVDPAHWGSLARAGLTLFEILTLEGWVDIMDASTAATRWAWVYYLSFVVLAVFVVVNLFIAIVINNLETAKGEAAAAAPAAARGAVDPAQAFADLRRRLDELEAAISYSERRNPDTSASPLRKADSGFA